eukprot:136044-Chlamydomonas_euryale.AAC.1
MPPAHPFLPPAPNTLPRAAGRCDPQRGQRAPQRGAGGVQDVRASEEGLAGQLLGRVQQPRSDEPHPQHR